MHIWSPQIGQHNVTTQRQTLEVTCKGSQSGEGMRQRRYRKPQEACTCNCSKQLRRNVKNKPPHAQSASTSPWRGIEERKRESKSLPGAAIIVRAFGCCPRVMDVTLPDYDFLRLKDSRYLLYTYIMAILVCTRLVY